MINNKRQILNFFKTIYILINLLFICKYGIRQRFISIYFLIILYTFIAGLILFKNPFDFKILKKINLKHYFIALSIALFITILAITFFTDGNTLHVDRWSAMDVAIRALLNGDYPYTATDHLNGRTSNFPGLLIIGIPFYLLGNVGYLQAVAFLLLSYTIYKTFSIKIAFHYLLLLLISPAYWWEIFTISDLFSNMILVFCFIVHLERKLKDNLFKHPIMLGISTSFLVLTRGIVAIPLILFVFKDFWQIRMINQLKYVFSFGITFVLLIGLVLMNCPDLQTLKSCNPLVLQTSYLPSYIHLIALLLPFYFSFKIKIFENDFYIACSLLILFPTLLAFMIRLNTIGFEKILTESYFDLSYLSIVLPFILYEIVDENKIGLTSDKSIHLSFSTQNK
jgi:hypothetical protein